MFAAIFTAVFGGITTMVENWQKKKQLEAEHTARVVEAQVSAQINRAAAAQNAEINWDTAAVSQMATSWKDEWFTLLLSVPLILAFLPWEWASATVDRGFDTLGRMPYWYAVSLGTAIAASFGYRKIVDAIAAWRSSKP